MTKISISISDDLLAYLDQKENNRSALIEKLLQQWRQQQQEEELATACEAVDQLELGWDESWQQVAITDSEVSGW